MLTLADPRVSAGEPVEDRLRLVLRMIRQEPRQRIHQWADEALAMPRERAVCREHESVMNHPRASRLDIEFEEVSNVLSDDGTLTCLRFCEQLRVWKLAKICILLNSNDVISPLAERLRDRGREHLVKKQPHASSRCSASQAARACSVAR